jgi:Fe-S cluster assembly protein SufD
MMTEIRSEIDDFQDLLTGIYQAIPKNASLEKMQAKSWERFCDLGLPTRKNDVFRYVKLRDLYRHTYQVVSSSSLSAEDISSHIYPECANSVLVFLNGAFSLQLSRLNGLPEKMIVMPLSEAMRPYGTLLTNQAIKAIKEEQDPFAALNLALHGEAAFLYLPPKTICQSPIQVLNIVDGGGNTNPLITPRLQLFAGAFSEIELISSHVKISSADAWINQRFDVALEENAHVRYVQLNHHASSDVWHFDTVRGTLKKSSSLTCVNVSNGSATVRNDYRVLLAGENCETSLNGVWVLKGRREAHQHIFIDHQAPNCFSRQLFKGALKDTSHSSFEGKIMVRQEAQETNAFQLNNNLLLSEGATAESKPNLEIFADNVKASHGATIGQLEKEELFYMQSRGFSSEEAKQLLVHGFCQEVLDLIRQEEIRQRVAVQLFK